MLFLYVVIPRRCVQYVVIQEVANLYVQSCLWLVVDVHTTRSDQMGSGCWEFVAPHQVISVDLRCAFVCD